MCEIKKKIVKNLNLIIFNIINNLRTEITLFFYNMMGYVNWFVETTFSYDWAVRLNLLNEN